MRPTENSLRFTRGRSRTLEKVKTSSKSRVPPSSGTILFRAGSSSSSSSQEDPSSSSKLDSTDYSLDKLRSFETSSSVIFCRPSSSPHLESSSPNILQLSFDALVPSIEVLSNNKFEAIVMPPYKSERLRLASLQTSTIHSQEMAEASSSTAPPPAQQYDTAKTQALQTYRKVRLTLISSLLFLTPANSLISGIQRLKEHEELEGRLKESKRIAFVQLERDR